MRARLHAAALGALRSADLELSPGRYVALGTEADPLRDLVSLLSGAEAARSGQVLLDGAPPVGSPSRRQKIASLLAHEQLPPARTVQSSLSKAVAARAGAAGAAQRATELLEEAGLSHLAPLSTASLGPRETRSVALSLALSHPSCDVLALYEPLATLVPASFVQLRLDEHTARGAIVFCATTSPADAALLGGSWLCVELGRVRSTPGPTPRLGGGPWQQVLVETSDARALSQLLHASGHGLSSELGASPHALKITGPALDVTVREIIALARQGNIEIQRIEAAVPPVEALMAARAGFARGAYEASRVSAQTTLAPSVPPGGTP